MRKIRTVNCTDCGQPGALPLLDEHDDEGYCEPCWAKRAPGKKPANYLEEVAARWAPLLARRKAT
jgi:hypothetical protein